MGKKYEAGQVLLIVILTMIVALTVGLSIAARIVTELKLSKQNEESQRAFQAAESGIQQTLSKGADVATVKLENNASFSTTLIEDKGTVIIMNNGQEVDQSVGGDVWLSDYSSEQSELFANPMGLVSGTYNPVSIRMYWGTTAQISCSKTASKNTAPAIEVVMIRGPLTNPTILRTIYETSNCTRIQNAITGAVLNPPQTPKNPGGPSFRNSATITFNGSTSFTNGLIMKIIPLYNSTIVGFQSLLPSGAPYSFPKQGSIVNSTGISGDTVRKVSYYQSYPQIPIEIFPYTIISQ